MCRQKTLSGTKDYPESGSSAAMKDCLTEPPLYH